MRRTLTLAVLAVLAGGLATPAYAQKQAPAVTRDSDRDGVPDNRDRCRNTPAGTRVDATGCPAPAGQAQAAPAGQAPAATPPGGAPAAAAPTGPPATVVQPQAQAGGPLAQPPPGQPAGPAGRPAATGQAAGAAGGQPAPATGQPAAPAGGQQVSAPPAGQPAAAAATTGQAAAAPAAGRPAAPAAGQPAAPATTQPAAPAAGQPAATPATGQAAQTGAARQPAGTPASPSGAAGAALGAAAPATQPPRGAPTGQPAALVATPPISVPAPPATNPTNTAGFWMPAYTGRSGADMLEYARSLAIRIDTAIVSLVEVFRNTSGAPMVGATGPSVLSTREKTRWERCRLIHYDLLTFADAATFLKDSLTSPAALGRAVAALDEGLQDLQATSACDDVVSMIEAPDRWAPWEQNYANTARNFYRDWYTQLRAVHEADRGLARGLNIALPAARQFPIPTGLPPNPPTIGAAR